YELATNQTQIALREIRMTAKRQNWVITFHACSFTIAIISRFFNTTDYCRSEIYLWSGTLYQQYRYDQASTILANTAKREQRNKNIMKDTNAYQPVLRSGRNTSATTSGMQAP